MPPLQYNVHDISERGQVRRWKKEVERIRKNKRIWWTISFQKKRSRGRGETGVRSAIFLSMPIFNNVAKKRFSVVSRQTHPALQTTRA
jgi:hypothetical protein